MCTDEEYVPISALTHFIYCQRRCALVHIEQLWAENRYTAEGQVLHERVDSHEKTKIGGVRVVRTLPIRSSRLGLSGQADVVEFHAEGKVMPVEYKRGRPKKDQCDEVQLCAQALCLEEMLSVEISEGALFYGQKRRRKTVVFDAALRELTISTARKVHELIEQRKTPPANYSKKCDQCSMLHLCMPRKCKAQPSVRRYLTAMIGESG
jgi:CRISPR-associated exonuclease Cas4